MIKTLLKGLLGLNLADLFLTLIFWHAEINPLVLGIGLHNFVRVKVITSMIFYEAIQ